MRLNHFGAIALTEDGGEDRFMAAGRSALLPLPGGAFDQDGYRYYGGVRQFSREFVFVDTPTATIQEQLDAFLMEVSKGRRILRAVTRDEDERQTWAKVTTVTYPYDIGDLAVQHVTAAFEADYPYWLRTVDEPYYLDEGHVLDAGWVLDSGHADTQALTLVSTTFTVTNSGAADVFRGVLTLTPAAASSMTTIRVLNNTTLDEFTWTGTLAAASVLSLDFLTKTVQVDFADDYDALSVPDNQLDWMRLAVGANSITVTAASITGTVNLRWAWSRHYL